MNDYKKELQNIQSYFNKYAALKSLNAGEELLYTYMGIINSEGVGFMDALMQRTGLDEDAVSLILDDYTLEVGAVMSTLMVDIAEIINSHNQELVNDKMSAISQIIIDILGESSRNILQKLVEHYQSEYKIFAKDYPYNDESKKVIKMLEENSQLLLLDNERVSTIPQEKLYMLIAMLFQEVFMVMSMVNMKELESGNKFDMITQEEYENEDFDVKEKIASEIAKARTEDMEIYERADFAYSPTEKVVCNICHKFFATSGIQRHVGSCAKKYVEDGGNKSSFLLKIYDKYMSDYFLHVLISEDAQLGHLDTFLRDIWLECCGHMSAFRQDRDELEMDDYAECLTHKKKTEYTYDFGSSTNLIIEFKKEFYGTQEHLIKLVARNTAIKAPCHICDKEDSKYICTECMYGGDEVIFCEKCVKKHIKKHHDGESYMISHFVNSPRTGVCGYGEMEDEF